MERYARGMAVLAFAIVAGCGGAGSGDGSGMAVLSASARVAVAPCSYTHVYVTARSLSVRIQSGSGETWHDISLPAPRRIDLMNLGAGVFDAMRIAPLPAGRYLELRLLLDADPAGHAVQSSDGALVPMTVPGGAVSGVKFIGDFQVAPWQSADVLPDGFDACASIVTVGNSGKYQLVPMIQAHAVATPSGQEVRMAAMQPLPTGGFAALNSVADAAVLQRFAPAGAYAGAEIRFGLSSTLARFASLRNGNYVLTSYLDPVEGPGLPTQPYRFMMQQYDAAGTPQGTLQQLGYEYPVYISHIYPPTLPTTAALTGGGYAILWGDMGHVYLLSSPGGGSVGAAQALDVQSPAQVIALATGGSMVVAGRESVVAVPFAANGTPLGSPQLVGATQWTPRGWTWTGVAAAPLAAGGAIVAWANEVSLSSGQQPALQVRRVANDGSPVGDAIALGPVDGGPASVAGLDDGGFVVAWVSGGHVLARRFTAAGAPAGDGTRLEVLTTSVGEVSVVATGAGGFIVSWSGMGSDGQRTRYGRLFDPSGLLPS